MPNQVTRFQRITYATARSFRPEVEKLFNRSYGTSGNAEGGNTFYSCAAFMKRFDAYAGNPRLDMVIGYIGEDAAGQAWGWPDNAKWQTELSESLEPRTAREMGGPSFALSEIMVARDYWGMGVAKEILDELLTHRPETVATLFVDPANQRAYGRYLRWGWWKIGTSRPEWRGAPVFDVLICEIRKVVSL